MNTAFADFLKEAFSQEMIIPPLFVGVANPTCGDTGTVIPGYPGACNGFVDVNGTAEKSGFTLAFVEVELNGGWTDYDFMPEFDLLNNKWSWSVPGVSGAFCECGPNTGDNTLVVRAYWEDTGMGMGWITEQVTCPFTGVCGSVTAPETTDAKQCDTESPVAVSISTEQKTNRSALVEPVVVEDGWLVYDNLLSSSSFDFGKILGLNGRPLSASTIAVYATGVQWYNHGQQDVRRAIGNIGVPFEGIRLGSILLGREPYRFHNVPKEGICVFQPGGLSNSRTTSRSVISESAHQPDVFSVYPDQPIVTRVNDDLRNRVPHTGNYSLRVKVIS